MKLAENVALLPIVREGVGFLNLVLTWDDNNLVLIDAGLPGNTGAIVKAIEDEGFRAQDLTHIIITHQDWDHIACLADLKEIAPAVRIVAHVDEAPYIDGRTVPIKLAERLAEYDTLTDEMRTGTDSWKELHDNALISIADEVHDGDLLPICGGIEIVHVPGHTPGHIALYLRQSRIIVCGDAANIDKGEMVGPNPIYTQDMALAQRSLEKIRNSDLSGIVAYHTGYLSVG